MRVAVLLLACCGSSVDPSPTPTSPGPSVQPRWIHRTWWGPAIVNNAPEITLCDDGRYHITDAFDAPPGASGHSVNTLGMGCCRLAERGTYELDRDPRGALVGVRFTPTWSREGKAAPHASTLDPSIDGDLNGFHPGPRAMPCRGAPD